MRHGGSSRGRTRGMGGGVGGGEWRWGKRSSDELSRGGTRLEEGEGGGRGEGKGRILQLPFRTVFQV